MLNPSGGSTLGNVWVHRIQHPLSTSGNLARYSLCRCAPTIGHFVDAVAILGNSSESIPRIHSGDNVTGWCYCVWLDYL